MKAYLVGIALALTLPAQATIDHAPKTQGTQVSTVGLKQLTNSISVLIKDQAKSSDRMRSELAIVQTSLINSSTSTTATSKPSQGLVKDYFRALDTASINPQALEGARTSLQLLGQHDALLHDWVVFYTFEQCKTFCDLKGASNRLAARYPNNAYLNFYHGTSKPTYTLEDGRVDILEHLKLSKEEYKRFAEVSPMAPELQEAGLVPHMQEAYNLISYTSFPKPQCSGEECAKVSKDILATTHMREPVMFATNILAADCAKGCDKTTKALVGKHGAMIEQRMDAGIEMWVAHTIAELNAFETTKSFDQLK